MSEHFDIFDENMRQIGVKARDCVHRDGDWHQVFHCWVVGEDASGSQFVILQMRAPDKDMYPGKLDISAAGHLEAGEMVADGIREIEEELGLCVRFDDLIPLGRRLGVARFCDLLDYQICHVFLYRCDQPLIDYVYQKDEITGLLKLPLNAGINLLSGEVERLTVNAVGFDADRISITAADFIPSHDRYTLKALVLARRYFQGEKHLLI